LDAKIRPTKCNLAALFLYGRYTLTMKMFRTLTAAALFGLCFSASAQWLWIDKDGHKVFSDRAPPADILEKNILKRPGGIRPVPVATPDAADPDAAPAATATSAPAVPVSGVKSAGVDKDLEAKKKLAKEAEAAKRKAVEDQFAKDKAENCARAKEAKGTYESGARVAKVNAAGERVFLDDAARAQELKRIQDIVSKDCK
jgi:hypothetical protein